MNEVKSVLDVGISEIWDEWMVEITGIFPLEGGMPKNENVIKAWLESKGEPKEVQKKQIEEMGLTDDEMAAEETKSWCGFAQNGNGIFIGAYQLKAMLKEC